MYLLIFSRLILLLSLVKCDDDFHISKKLHDEIKSKSHPYTQPKNFTSDDIVRLYVDLYQILDVNEKSGAIAVKLTQVVMYSCEAWTWNSEDYGGVSALQYPLGTFWVPPMGQYSI